MRRAPVHLCLGLGRPHLLQGAVRLAPDQRRLARGSVQEPRQRHLGHRLRCRPGAGGGPRVQPQGDQAIRVRLRRPAPRLGQQVAIVRRRAAGRAAAGDHGGPSGRGAGRHFSADPLPPAAGHADQAGPGGARGVRYLRLHLPGWHHRHLRQGRSHQLGQIPALRAHSALHLDLLQPEPRPDRHDHVVVYRQEPLVREALARPPEGLPAPGERPRDEDRRTRKPMSLWDRLKFLILLALVWWILVWSAMANNPLISIRDAIRTEVRSGWWVFVLAGLEALRQIHFLISEHWAAYHRFWTQRVFGGLERLTHRRLSDWTRFRLRRLFTWVLWIVIAAVVTGKIIHTSPVLALLRAPQLLWHVLPFVLQLAFAFFFIAFQFIGLFWLLSRGGVDVYYPDDIKTRFSDVWGQDHVLERVKENIIYLEDPERIETRGGHVPGGILLWGPPGTGKTLMAEAVAGETGRPYVFVDPGAFNNMFFGVGILKVKALFRKLRRLALRYGGVIVFFDEADSLGSRGALAQRGAFPRGFSAMSTPSTPDGCHGMAYLSPEAAWHVVRNRQTVASPERVRTWKTMPVMNGMMNGGGGGGMGTLQALLTELSGLKKPRGFVNRYVRRVFGMRPKPPPKYRILVMMATNMPSALDEALLRPGRIDRIYKVGYPSKAGRIRTYEGYLDKVQHELTAEQVDKLATITPYATGATIKDL